MLWKCGCSCNLSMKCKRLRFLEEKPLFGAVCCLLNFLIVLILGANERKKTCNENLLSHHILWSHYAWDQGHRSLSSP